MPHAREDMERGKLWSHRNLAQTTLSMGLRGCPKAFRHASGCICGRFCRAGYRKVACILHYPFPVSLEVVTRVTVLSVADFCREETGDRYRMSEARPSLVWFSLDRYVRWMSCGCSGCSSIRESRNDETRAEASQRFSICCLRPVSSRVYSIRRAHIAWLEVTRRSRLQTKCLSGKLKGVGCLNCVDSIYLGGTTFGHHASL